MSRLLIWFRQKVRDFLPAVDKVWTYQNTFGSDSASTTIQEVFNLAPSPNSQDPHLISFINEVKFTATPAVALAVVSYFTDSISNYKLTIGGQVYMDYNQPKAGVWGNAQNIGPLSLLTKKSGGDLRYEPFSTTSLAAVDVVFYWELPVGLAVNGQMPVQINQTVADLSSNWAGEDAATISSMSWNIWARYGIAQKTFRYGSTQKEIFSDTGETRPITMIEQQNMTILGVLVSQDSVSDDITEAHIRDGSVNQKSLELLRYLNGDYSQQIEVVNPSSTGHLTDDTQNPVGNMYTNMGQITGQLWLNTFGWPAGSNLTMDIKSSGSTYFLPLYVAPLTGTSAGNPPQQFQQVGNIAADIVNADTEIPSGRVSSSNRVSAGRKRGFSLRR